MKKVSKEEFDTELKKYPDLQSHEVHFCTPSVTFYWKTKASPEEDRAFGNGSFARKVDINPYFPETSEEKYYINE